MTKKIKKFFLFEIYSDNLKNIFDKAKNKDLPREFGCFCPICEKHFTINQIHDLSLEHNPPKSLGGKDNILTCVNCNNKAGSEIDSEILLALNELEFMMFKPNSSLKTRFHNYSTNENGINGNIMIDNEGKFIINISPANNPKTINSFVNSIEIDYQPYNLFLQNNEENFGSRKKLNFDFKKPNSRNERLASISLLKMGYLLAFEKLGHILMFGQNMQIVRNQIQNPLKNIITKPFWLHYKYPDEMLGINIITKPIELKCILVIFDLITKSDKYRIGICLPGFDDDDLMIYENIENLVCTGTGFLELELNNYLNKEFDVRKNNNSFLPILFWEKLFENIKLNKKLN